MNGRVLAFSADVGAGIIRCSAGKDHIFYLKDWCSTGLPEPNIPVEFEAGNGHARDVRAA